MKTELIQTKTDPRVERMNEVQSFYGLLYENDHEDSPHESRVSILKRLHSHIANIGTKTKILDIGAGIQVLESMYEKKYGIPIPQITTLDFAEVKKERLMTSDNEHIIASGTNLPFKDNSFNLLISNMALDFMPIATLSEVSRVLADDGHLILNLHHPDLIPKNLEDLEKKFNRKIRYRSSMGKPLTKSQFKTRAYLNQMRFLRDERILYESEDDIRKTFEPLGFFIDNVDHKTSNEGPWWEADMQKKF